MANLQIKGIQDELYAEIKKLAAAENRSVSQQILFLVKQYLARKKHLNTLIEVKKQGIRAVMLYVVQRMDVETFGTAKEIDPEYAKSLRKAINNGVEVIAVQAKVSPEGIEIVGEMPVEI